MNFFQKKLKVVGFFDGKTLRVARISDDEKKNLIDEKTYSFDVDPRADVFSRIQEDFGKKIHLVVAEEGMYTFSLDIPEKEGTSRKTIEKALRDSFPEESVSTVWDYRILSKKEGRIFLEVTEMKKNWSDTLREGRATGVFFESIIPESLSLSRIVAKDSMTLIAHRKGSEAFLLLCCEAGIVYVSLFLKKPFLPADIASFLEYCQKKKGKEVVSLYGSGFSEEELRECSLVKEVSHEVLDPLLGAGREGCWKKDADTLDLAISMRENPWYFLNVHTMKKEIATNTKGFTLLEILIAVGIIAILATIIVIALDPAERFRNARESRRLSDIQTISNAVHQYLIDKKGKFPEGIDERERQLGTASSGCEIENSICHVKNTDDCVNLSGSLKSYLTSIPEDPETGNSELTHYTIEREKAGNRIIVRACDSTENYVIQ